MAAEPFTPSSDDAPESVRIFGVILRALVQTVGRLFHRRPDRVVWVLPLHIWLNRAVRRLERAMARPVVVVVAAPDPVRRERGERKERVRLPARRRWLVQELGWEVTSYGSQLRHLLGQPEMQAALAEKPAVGRILRPICRMLGIEVPGLARVVDPVARPRTPRRSRARLWPRKGLPVVPKGGWFEPPVKNRG